MIRLKETTENAYDRILIQAKVIDFLNRCDYLNDSEGTSSLENSDFIALSEAYFIIGKVVMKIVKDAINM